MYSDFGGGGNVTVTNSSFEGGSGTAFSISGAPSTVSVTGSRFANIYRVVTTSYLNNPYSVTMHSSRFSNVTQGFYHYDMQSTRGSLDLHSCTFTGCGAEKISGAAVYAGDSVSVTIEQSTFKVHDPAPSCCMPRQDGCFARPWRSRAVGEVATPLPC